MLVEYMADKKEAKVEDVAQNVHENEETSEKTIRANAQRTIDWLAERGERLIFNVACGRVFRDIPAK
jgi:hypothetical protein